MPWLLLCFLLQVHLYYKNSWIGTASLHFFFPSKIQISTHHLGINITKVIPKWIHGMSVANSLHIGVTFIRYEILKYLFNTIRIVPLWYLLYFSFSIYSILVKVTVTEFMWFQNPIDKIWSFNTLHSVRMNHLFQIIWICIYVT